MLSAGVCSVALPEDEVSAPSLCSGQATETMILRFTQDSTVAGKKNPDHTTGIFILYLEKLRYALRSFLQNFL